MTRAGMSQRLCGVFLFCLPVRLQSRDASRDSARGPTTSLYIFPRLLAVSVLPRNTRVIFASGCCFRASRKAPTTSEGSSSPPPPPPMARHTIGSARNSPRMPRKHHQGSASLATTPTQATSVLEFAADGVLPGTGSRPGGLDRVILERNLERLLQERSSHPEETPNELGR